MSSMRLFILLPVALMLMVQPVAAKVPSSKAEVQLTFAPVVKKAAPAVVNIYVSGETEKEVAVRGPFPGMTRRGIVKAPFSSLGSGVLISKQGLIVSNHHVVDKASNLKVVLQDQREFDAVVLGADERFDLALLKIEPDDDFFEFMEMGSSDEMEVGDLVLAIGNARGFEHTVTSGIVSAKGRKNSSMSKLQTYIQTDATINPGNSGGALVNMAGQLIGINSWVYYGPSEREAQGLGFAIPVEMVKEYVKAVESGRTTISTWFGADGQEVTQEIADGLGRKRPGGVLLTDIYANGPADRAGLKVKDVVESVDGHPVNSMNDLRGRMLSGSKQSSAQVAAWRDGKQFTVKVLREDAPELPRDERRLEGRHPLNGITVANLSPAYAEELGMDPMRSGVVVTEMSRGSYAARLGLRPGDVIASLNRSSVRSTEHLNKLIGEGGGRWEITIERNGDLQSVTVEMN